MDKQIPGVINVISAPLTISNDQVAV